MARVLHHHCWTHHGWAGAIDGVLLCFRQATSGGNWQQWWGGIPLCEYHKFTLVKPRWQNHNCFCTKYQVCTMHFQMFLYNFIIPSHLNSKFVPAELKQSTILPHTSWLICDWYLIEFSFTFGKLIKATNQEDCSQKGYVWDLSQRDMEVTNKLVIASETLWHTIWLFPLISLHPIVSTGISFPISSRTGILEFDN